MMDTASIIATAGVSLLLLAYILNMVKVTERTSYLYILMNLVGAGISCYASVLIDFMPFVVLEGFWAAVSLGALVNKAVAVVK